MDDSKEFDYVATVLRGYRAWMTVHGKTDDEFEAKIATIINMIQEDPDEV